MGQYTEEQIKGAIGQVIAEEMFRELGFLVLKFGKEHTANPLTQLKEFVARCGGEFKPQYESEAKEYIDSLPDFIIVDPKTGEYDFLEVKFRANGVLEWNEFETSKHTRTMEFFPATTLVINQQIHPKLFEQFVMDSSLQSELKNTRFHVYDLETSENEKDGSYTLSTLAEWLDELFEIKQPSVLDKYEKLVQKWFKN